MNVNAYGFKEGSLRASLRIAENQGHVVVVLDMKPLHPRTGSARYTLTIQRARRIIEGHFLYGFLPFHIATVFRRTDGTVLTEFNDKVDGRNGRWMTSR